VTICTKCGRENPDDARFCNSCAAPLVSREPPREERKIVSVLFADLVGFTDRAERMDPEDVRALQDPYWGHLRSELERHGGTAEKFIGDAVMALFGAPVAHEDDPERAVRAALAIRDWAREQEKIQVRIAVTTGEALVRLGAHPLGGEGMASGDVVNTASRLQKAAPANGIAVDERTYRSTKHVIDYRSREPLEVRGKAKLVSTWEAVEARSRFGVDVITHDRTPLIGRRRELELLRATLARVREEGAPQLFTIVGVPGIGKSRLVYELMQAVADDPSGIVTWRQGRSLPYGDGVTFWALAEMVKAQAGILETDADEQAEEKLARAVRQLVADDAEAAWVERQVRPLIGLGGERDVSGERRSEARAAWRRFFEALAEWRPLVLVFEDLHWADDGLLDFVDSLVEWVRDVSLLVVATARPELLERRSSWGGGKANATTLSLSPLSEEETGHLISALVKESFLLPELQAALSAHAEGNALYAEQYVRMMGERGQAQELPMPETVHGIIAARLDALSDSEKCLLQNAAVFGKVFWDSAVLALGGIDGVDAAECLHALDRKEFVQRARRSSVAGAREYAFRHVLFRDVAYSQIPRAVRAEKHRCAAEWIESLGRSEDHAEMLAHHYLSALELARAAGRSTIALADTARISVRRAGDRALGVNGFESAAVYYEQALELWPETDPEWPQVLFAHARALYGSGAAGGADALKDARAELYESGDVEGAAEADAMLADIWWDRGQPRQADEHVGRALTLIYDRPPSPAKAHVLSLVARARMRASDNEEAIAVAREAMALAEAFDLQDLRADTLITMGTARWIEGDLDATADLEHGLQIALEHNALSAVWRGYNNLAIAVGARGELARHDELLGEAVQLANRLGARDRVRFLAAQLIWGERRRGQWDNALRSADEFIAECEAGSPHRQEQGMRLLRAKIHVARGDVKAALLDCDQALALARDSHDPGWLSEALGSAVEIHAEAGRLDEARALADEVLSYDPTPDLDEVISKLAWHAHSLGLDEQQLRPHLEAVRSFWRRVAELALAGAFEELADLCAELSFTDREAEARLRAAEALLETGRLDEARAHLRKALAFFRSVRATRFIRLAETLSERVEYASYPGR
jgi:class 3 adenylate cyclase/tetratricopeptide (TPR) repeat protein